MSEKHIVWEDWEKCRVDWPATIAKLNTRNPKILEIVEDFTFEQRDDGWYGIDSLGTQEVGPYYTKSDVINAVRQGVMK
jgi:hypothetical protein